MSLLSNLGRGLASLAKGAINTVEQSFEAPIRSAVQPFITAGQSIIRTIQTVSNIPGAKVSVAPLPVPKALQPFVGSGRPVVPGGIGPNVKPMTLSGAPGGPSPFSFFGGGGGSSGRGRVSPGDGGACPRGYHLNKHKLADGTPARSVCVRNRHMNPVNGHAIARAARRIHKGEKLLRRIFQVEGKHHGKIRPRTRGRKK